jgi:hypothetical protein
MVISRPLGDLSIPGIPEKHGILYLNIGHLEKNVKTVAIDGLMRILLFLNGKSLDTPHSSK